MAKGKTIPPFTWLVVHVVTDWPQVGPPAELMDAPARAMAEIDHKKRTDLVVFAEGQHPEAVHYHERTATIVERFGANRSDAFLSPMHRDEYLSWTLGSCISDAHSTQSVANVGWDAPSWFGTLRDGVAWANVKSRTHLLPGLGDFYPAGPPSAVAATLGPKWDTYRFGLVHVEVPSQSAHVKMALRRRLLADLTLFDAWVRRGERTPYQVVDL
jgi:hypothetical protein